MKQIHILYSGQVQGVGFRFTTQRLAQQADVHGWVKNLPSGEVEVLAQGGQESLSRFIKSLETRFEGYIRDKKQSQQEPSDTFQGFDIAF